MKTLEQILDEIQYDNLSNFNWEDFTNQIEDQLPGYDVLYVDMDNNEENEELPYSIAEIVSGKFVEDMQVEQWTTNEMDFVCKVIAIKLKK